MKSWGGSLYAFLSKLPLVWIIFLRSHLSTEIWQPGISYWTKLFTARYIIIDVIVHLLYHVCRLETLEWLVI